MVYSVDEAFNILKQENITKSVQALRRWLRTGELKGKRASRKKAGKLQRRIYDHLLILGKVTLKYQIRQWIMPMAKAINKAI